MLLLPVPARLNWSAWQKLWRKDSHVLLIRFPHSGAPLLLTTVQNPFPPWRKIGCVQLLTPQLLCSVFGMSTVWFTLCAALPLYPPPTVTIPQHHLVPVRVAFSFLPHTEVVIFSVLPYQRYITKPMIWLSFQVSRIQLKDYRFDSIYLDFSRLTSTQGWCFLQPRVGW